MSQYEIPEEHDTFDHYVKPATVPLRLLNFDPAWDMRTMGADVAMNGEKPQFRIVFRFVVVAVTGYGGYLADENFPKKLKDVQRLEPVSQQTGVTCRIPFLVKITGMEIKKGTVVYREPHPSLR